jgi:hypothetical protein
MADIYLTFTVSVTGERESQSQSLSPNWEKWQIGTYLPNTQPRSLHEGLNFGCVKCGALVVRDEEIQCIHNESIWTYPSLDFVAIEETVRVDNKNYQYHNVRCEVCHCTSPSVEIE